MIDLKECNITGGIKETEKWDLAYRLNTKDSRKQSSQLVSHRECGETEEGVPAISDSVVLSKIKMMNKRVCDRGAAGRPGHTTPW